MSTPRGPVGKTGHVTRALIHCLRRESKLVMEGRVEPGLFIPAVDLHAMCEFIDAHIEKMEGDTTLTDEEQRRAYHRGKAALPEPHCAPLTDERMVEIAADIDEREAALKRAQALVKKILAKGLRIDREDLIEAIAEELEEVARAGTCQS